MRRDVAVRHTAAASEGRRWRSLPGVVLAVLVLVAALPAAALADAGSWPKRTFVTDGSVRVVLPTPSAVYIGGNFASVGPRTGAGVGINLATGRTRTGPAVAGGAQEVQAVAPDGSGGYYIGGRFNHVGTSFRRGLAHVLADGRLDPTFRPNPDGAVSAIAVSGNTVYVGGSFNSVGGQVRRHIAALRAGTGAVTGWSPDADRGVTALAVSDQMVYAGGAFRQIGGRVRHGLAAIDATTANATNWDPQVGYRGVPGSVSALAVAGNTVYAGGRFDSIGGLRRSDIAAINATTAQPTGWDPHASGVVEALAVSGDTLYAGGYFGQVGGEARPGLAAIDRATGGATSWNPHPSNAGSTSYVNTLAVSGQTVYAGGVFTSIGGRTRHNIAGLDATTGAATDWNPYANGAVYTMAIAGQTLYAGGSFTSVGARTRDGIAALDPATGSVTSWSPGASQSGYGSAGTPTVDALAVSGQTVYAGGHFEAMGGQPRNNLAALDATTGQATAWNPDIQGGSRPDVTALVAAGPTIYAGGGFQSVGALARDNIAAIDATTGQATAWAPNADAAVLTLALDGSTLYAGGGFHVIGGQARSNIAALDSVTGDATSWDPEATITPGYQGLVDTVTVSGGTVYAGGAFDTIGGKPRNGIAALDPGTGQATTWDPDVRAYVGESALGVVHAIAVSGQTVYAGGNFRSVSGEPRSALAAIDATSGAVLPWNPMPMGPFVNALAVDPSGAVWVGGSFFRFPTVPQSGIAKFTP